MSFPPVPNEHNDLLDYKVVGDVAHFYYPEGTRTFDGRTWVALPHKRENT